VPLAGLLVLEHPRASTAFEGSQRTQLDNVELLGGSPGRQTLPKRAGASFETSESGGNNASASDLIGYRARRIVRCISPNIRANTRFGLLLRLPALLSPPVLSSPLLRLPALLSPPVLSSPLLRVPALLSSPPVLLLISPLLGLGRRD